MVNATGQKNGMKYRHSEAKKDQEQRGALRFAVAKLLLEGKNA